MRAFFDFFFGTPRRFLGTMACLFLIFAMFFPFLAMQMLNNALIAVIGAVDPLIGPLLAIAIAVWAIWHVMLRPHTKKKKKKDH